MIRFTTHEEVANKTLPVMLDLETLGTGANSAIIAIGACQFDPATNEIYGVFEAVLDRNELLAMGCTVDQSTLAWWQSQSAEARAKSFEHPSPASAVAVLRAFSDWMDHGAELWGNGSDFDNAMLAELYRKAGLEQPWKFWHNRCYRTMKNQFPEVLLSRHGVHHNALDDAISQAKHLMKIINRAHNMRRALG